MRDSVWHILTGEYPPQTGGVSDYTARVAEGLAARGESVYVWTRPFVELTPETFGVEVRRVAGRWGRRDLGRLHEELSRWDAPRRLLVQYAPNAWGRKGLNFAFCNWLLQRRKLGDDVRLMVHEPFYPYQLWGKPTRWLLAAGQRHMMRTLLQAATKVYVAIPAWAEMLRPFAADKEREMTWLPICSTIPVAAQATQINALRQWFAPSGEFIVGSFGTFGGAVADATERIFAALLAERSDTVALFIGQGGERLAQRLAWRFPALAGRVRASGALPAADVSCHLQACDVLVQPFPDGISTRRTSAIAGLAHAQPIVTTQGALSEPLWAGSGAVRLANAGDWVACVKAVKSLLDDEAARQELGAQACDFYDAHLALRHTIDKLLV